MPSEEVLSLLSALPCTALLVDREGVIRWANARSRELLGYDPGELVGQAAEALIPPHLRGAHARLREAGCDRGPAPRHAERPHRTTLCARNGELVPVEIDFVPWPTPGGEFLLLLARRAATIFLELESIGRQRFQAHALTLAETLSGLARREEILDALAEGLRKAFDAESVTVWEADEEGEALVLRAAAWSGAPGIRPGYALPRDDPREPLARAAERGRGEVLRHIAAGVGVLGGALGLRSAILVPVGGEGGPRWVAAIGDGNDPERFTELDLMGAHLLVHLAAASLQRAELLEQTQRRLERLQTLREIDLAITSNLDPHFTIKVLLEETLDRLGADAAAVLLLEPESMTLRVAGARGFGAAVVGLRIPLNRSFARRVTRERRPLFLEIPSLPPEIPSPLIEAARGEGFRALHIAPMISKQRLLGVLEVFHREPPRPPEEWTDFMEALASQAAIAVENANLLSELQRTNFELRIAYEATLRSWGQLLELRDRETKGHTERVVELTVKLARELGVRGEELMYMRWGALLHDIGKLGIPDSIMLKPGALTGEEWEVMRKHPVYAYEVLSEIEFLRPALHIPYCHHERWDGTGYPRGLRGEEIPLAARIFAVVDAWDAMRSGRPYRGPLSREAAIGELERGAGTQFDPRVVKAFLALVDRGEV
ncbi:MAG: GAF domain-containing protein [Caldiserica bacterium]|nr:GAF domain-containing protein [Caldisericota bacterium]